MIKDGDIVIYLKQLGWFVVVDGKMIQLRAFTRGPLTNPSLEIQEKAASKSLLVSEAQQQPMKSIRRGKRLPAAGAGPAQQQPMKSVRRGRAQAWRDVALFGI